MSTLQPTLVAGETLNYRATLASHPAGDGWVLTLYLNPRAGGTATSVTSTADGDDHLLQVPAATTAAWAAGAYAWEIWATLGGERYRIESGQLQVVASLIGAGAGQDTRTDAERALELLRAAWSAYIASGNFTVAQYTINGRSMTYRTIAELRAAISAAERDVNSERAAARLAQGLAPRNRFVVRM